MNVSWLSIRNQGWVVHSILEHIPLDPRLEHQSETSAADKADHMSTGCFLRETMQLILGEMIELICHILTSGIA